MKKPPKDNSSIKSKSSQSKRPSKDTIHAFSPMDKHKQANHIAFLEKMKIIQLTPIVHPIIITSLLMKMTEEDWFLELFSTC
jgi:hypothetical protein